MNGVSIVKPVNVTDAMLTSNVAETDHPAWNAATAYTVGQRVIRTTTHKIYERLVSGTTATAPESDPVNWVEISATNRWMMFDATVGTQTINAGSIVVEIAPGQAVNAVALLNTTATSVRVKMTDPTEGVVYDQTSGMTAPPPEATAWSYFFDPIEQKTQLVFTGLPSYGSAVIEVTITAATGDAKCGVLLVGTARTFSLGTQLGARFGITDYSIKTRDSFGNYRVTERAYSKRAAIDMIVPRAEVNAMASFFAGIRTTPTLFIADDYYDGLVVFGYYKNFEVTIAYPTFSQCQLEIEGLI